MAKTVRKRDRLSNMRHSQTTALWRALERHGMTYPLLQWALRPEHDQYLASMEEVLTAARMEFDIQVQLNVWLATSSPAASFLSKHTGPCHVLSQYWGLSQWQPAGDWDAAVAEHGLVPFTSANELISAFVTALQTQDPVGYKRFLRNCRAYEARWGTSQGVVFRYSLKGSRLPAELMGFPVIV